MNSGMTEQELSIMNLTVEIWHQFRLLPNKHVMDMEELSRDIHSIQHRVMARVAARAHPDIFGFGKEAA